MVNNVQDAIKQKTSFPALRSVLYFEREKIYIFF